MNLRPRRTCYTPPELSEPSNKAAIGITVGVILIFGLGVYAGRYLTQLPFDRSIGHWDRARTLGALARTDDERKRRAQAYLDPKKALAEMQEYGWAPTNVPTPFVGVGPMPGHHTGIEINAQQFRGARTVTMPKPKGVFRVLLTGGSTAFSSGAPSLFETIGGQFEACLLRTRPNAEVHTFANPAWASTHERIAIENRLTEFEPDVIVSFTGVNDVHWGLRGRDTMWLRTYWDQTYFDVIERVFSLTGRGVVADPTVIRDTPVSVSRLADNFEKNSWLAAYAASRVGAKYIVALQPNLAVTTKPLTSREGELVTLLGERKTHYVEAYPEFRARLAKVDAPNFLWWDLSDVFEDESAEVFLDSYHFGDRGNAIIGDAMCKALLGALP